MESAYLTYWQNELRDPNVTRLYLYREYNVNTVMSSPLTIHRTIRKSQSVVSRTSEGKNSVPNAMYRSDSTTCAYCLKGDVSEEHVLLRCNRFDSFRGNRRTVRSKKSY